LSNQKAEKTLKRFKRLLLTIPFQGVWNSILDIYQDDFEIGIVI